MDLFLLPVTATTIGEDSVFQTLTLFQGSALMIHRQSTAPGRDFLQGGAHYLNVK
jgi:hypothetical protein